MGRQIKLIAILFVHTGNSIYRRGTAADLWWVGGGQVSGIAGVSELFSAVVTGLVKRNVDCTVAWGLKLGQVIEDDE